MPPSTRAESPRSPPPRSYSFIYNEAAGENTSVVKFWDEETAAKYDADAAEHFPPEVLGPTVDALEWLVEDGSALEFAIGTGRVGIPLAARGVPVTGIELSAPMVAQLRRKVGAEELSAAVGDMATTVVPGAGTFSLVFLGVEQHLEPSDAGRAGAVHRERGRASSPGRRFVIDLWLPPTERLPPREQAVPMSLNEGHLVFDTYDLLTQECASHHYHRDDDGSIRYGSGHFRYVWPAECDLMAQLSGLELESRSTDWEGSPFLATSGSHVSVWRKV